MNTILSIDFDFWVPVHPDLRPTFAEQGGTTDLLNWYLRASEASRAGVDLRRAIQVSKTEFPSPSELPAWLAARNISINAAGAGVMDQHHFAYEHFCDVRDAWLVHVDAHHDLGYTNDADGVLHCGNWVRRLIENGSVSKVTLIYPNWRNTKRQRECLEDVRTKPWFKKGNVEIRHGLWQIGNNMHFDKAAIARSGAWTPPWLDEQFEQFVVALVGGDAKRYEPTLPREFNLDWAAVVENRRRSDALLQTAAEAALSPADYFPPEKENDMRRYGRRISCPNN